MNNLLPDYRFLFANMTQGAFFQNADGTICDVNPAALKMFGLSHDELTGRTSCHPEWRVVAADGTPLPPEQHPSMVTLTSGTKVTDFVAGVYNPQQQAFVWLNINTVPMFRPGESSPYRVFVTLDDISARQRATQALQESEARYRAIVNSQTEFVDRYLPGGVLTFVNDALCRYTGVEREALLGKTFYDFIPQEDLSELVRLLASRTPEDPSADTVNRIVFPDGSQRWTQWTNTALFDARGGIVEYQSVGRDVTEQILAKESLERSERLFREFFNLPLVGAAITSPIKGWLAVNDKLCAILGYPKDELVRMTWSELTHPDDLAADIAQFDRVIAGEIDGYVMEKRYVRKDGTIIWANIAAQCFRDQSGAVEYFAGLVQDITERKKVLEELAYVNECFTQALNGSQHILYRMNVKKDRYDYLSSSSEKIHGIPHEEGLKFSLDMVMQRIHPEDRVRISADIDAAVRARTANSIDLELEYRLRKTDGDYCWLHDSTTLIVDDNGELDLFFGSAYDVTARKRTEELLQASEARYRRFIATAHEGIGIADENLHLTYVNNRLAEMLGYPPEELLGKPARLLVQSDDLKSQEQTLAVRKAGISGANEYRYQRQDGSYAWLLTSSTPILDDTGKFQGCFAMFTDLTGRREAEIALRQAHDELEQRVEERTAALASANEQIKRMSFQLVRAEEVERARIAAELHDQVGQSLLLAKMKLDMLSSELDSGAAAEIAALLENSLNDIRTLTFGMRPPLLETAGIEAALEWLCTSLFKDYALRVEFSPSGEPLLFSSETRYSLFQAIRELLLNVAKHAGIDRAELTLRKTADHLVVRVVDTGSGFAPATMADNGFGLYNVRQRIEQLGGRFIMFSSEDGTNATLLIPLAKPSPGEQPCN